MKIVSQTPTRLVATDKNLAGLVAGLALAVVGLVIAVSGQNIIAGILGFALMGAGVYVVVMRHVRTLVADKGVGKVSVQIKSLLRNQLYEYLFHDIAMVKFTPQASMTAVNDGPAQDMGMSLGGLDLNNLRNRLQPTQPMQLVLVLHNGTTADLARGWETVRWGGLLGGVLGREVGQQVATLVGVPFEAAATADASAVVAEGSPEQSQPASPPVAASPTSAVTTSPQGAPEAPVPVPAAAAVAAAPVAAPEVPAVASTAGAAAAPPGGPGTPTVPSQAPAGSEPGRR
jgi:hypothetical protein